MSQTNDSLQYPTTNYYGSPPKGNKLSREINKKPTPRVEKIRNRYFETKSSASMEFPYWYTRRWEELEGEVPIVRRAEAMKAGFEHLTPSIFPGELLVMGKANYLRGSFPLPWLSEAFFLAKEDEMYQEAMEAAKVSADEVMNLSQIF